MAPRSCFFLHFIFPFHNHKDYIIRTISLNYFSSVSEKFGPSARLHSRQQRRSQSAKMYEFVNTTQYIKIAKMHPKLTQHIKNIMIKQEMSFCYLRISRTIHPTYFTLGRCVVQDLRRCSLEFALARYQWI